MNYKTGLAILIALVALVLLGRLVLAHPAVKEAEAHTNTKEIVPTLSPTPIVVNEDVKREIIEVFGEYSDKAFLLLQGGGKGTCVENTNLDPKAVNLNKDGSKDLGVFQLNDNWHGFKKTVNNERYLLDSSINIRMAYRLFKESGDSFKLWTCGKAYGI